MLKMFHQIAFFVALFLMMIIGLIISGLGDVLIEEFSHIGTPTVLLTMLIIAIVFFLVGIIFQNQVARQQKAAIRKIIEEIEQNQRNLLFTLPTFSWQPLNSDTNQPYHTSVAFRQPTQHFFRIQNSLPKQLSRMCIFVMGLLCLVVGAWKIYTGFFLDKTIPLISSRSEISWVGLTIICFIGGVAIYIPFIMPNKAMNFDKSKDLFWYGSSRWSSAMMAQQDNQVRISDIIALQFLNKTLVDSEGESHVFELNLLQKNGSRINLLNSWSRDTLLSQAKVVADFLHIPILSDELLS